VATLGESVVGTAVYGPVRTVVWEDGGREAPSYPITRQKSRGPQSRLSNKEEKKLKSAHMLPHFALWDSMPALRFPYAIPTPAEIGATLAVCADGESGVPSNAGDTARWVTNAICAYKE
jgi:hypothetical protein